MHSVSSPKPAPDAFELHVDGTVFASDNRGGVWRFMQRMLEQFAQWPEQLTVFLYLPAGQGRPPVFPDTIQVIEYLTETRIRPRRLALPAETRWFQRQQSKMWARPSQGVYHSTFCTTHPSLRIPEVVTIQDMIFEDFPDCFIPHQHRRHVQEKLDCVNAAKMVVFPSQASLEAARRHYDLDGKELVIIPYAVEPRYQPITDATRLQAFRDKYTSGQPYLLFVGARWAHKNFAGLLAAVAHTPELKDWHILATGGGPANREELAVTRGLGLSDQVHYVPRLDEDELVMSYNAAATFVMPSLSEGYGFPLMEAMGCGVPAAAANAGSLPELGHDVAFWFEPTDGPDMAKAILAALAEPRDSDRIRAGIERAANTSWKQVAEAYVAAYRKLLTL